MMKHIIIALSAILAVTLAQQGRYRPTPSISVFGGNAGRYTGNAGRYNPDTTGRYSGASDGRYRPDSSGSYAGSDGKYYHDDSGKYNPDGSGIYSGQNGGYDHDGSGVYKGVNDKYQGDKYQGDKYQGDKYGGGKGSGSGTGVGSIFGAGSGIGGGTKRPVTSGLGSGSGSKSGSGSGSKSGAGSGSGNGINPAGGFGAPVGLKQGSASGKYDNRNYRIIRQEGGVEEDGYHYLYETENGIFGEEQGKLANRDTDAEAMRASGYFTYTGPDSVEYTVRYTADENGFVPDAAHLPTPPPVPEAILRALEWQRQQGTL